MAFIAYDDVGGELAVQLEHCETVAPFEALQLSMAI
jgi:hypothetical protein